MNATDILKYGQQTVLQAIDGFPATGWEIPGACGVWSVKDIIAHLASYEQVLIDILTTFTGKGSTPVLNRFIELGVNSTIARWTSVRQRLCKKS